MAVVTMFTLHISSGKCVSKEETLEHNEDYEVIHWITDAHSSEEMTAIQALEISFVSVCVVGNVCV